MKAMIIGLLFVSSVNAQASKPVSPEKEARICQKLNQQALATCEKELIQECKENGGEDCENVEGDFNEGVQICAGETEMPFLIEKYNKNNGTNITCEDY